MNQVQVLGIIRKNKTNILTSDAIKIPLLEIEYLAEYGRDDYRVEKIRIILDNPSLAPWVYSSKGTLIYIIGKAVMINGEVFISANSILLVRDHSGKAGTTLLFQYGTSLNQFIISGELSEENKIVSEKIHIRGSIDNYKTIPIINEGICDKHQIERASCLILGKPSSKGIVI